MFDVFNIPDPALTMTSLPLWMNGLTPEMVKKAEEELGETIEVRTQALKDFRRLINGKEEIDRRKQRAYFLFTAQDPVVSFR